MYDIDRPKFIFVSLLEEFIREAEHSLAYFFALLVFLLTFLLTLFGREAFYTGLIGVFCLLLIKLRDIIEGIKETRNSTSFYPVPEKRHDLQTAFDEASLTLLAKDFFQRFNEKKQTTETEKNNLLAYLQTFREITETICLIFPEKSFHPETRLAVLKMIEGAEEHLQLYLKNKFNLNAGAQKKLREILTDEENDSFLLHARLESMGIDDKTAQWSVNILQILRKIKSFVSKNEDKKKEKQLSVSPLCEQECS